MKERKIGTSTLWKAGRRRKTLGQEEYEIRSEAPERIRQRKYGKRRPAFLLSFSSIRFELLSSRRALSIVAENYFIIARSAGLKCSRRGSARRRREPEGGANEKPNTRRTIAPAIPRFIDLAKKNHKSRKTSII